MTGSALVLTVLFLAACFGVVASGAEGVLLRVTSASGPLRVSIGPSLSEDGSWLAFAIDSDFLGQVIADNQNEIWLYDTVTMTYTRVTTA